MQYTGHYESPLGAITLASDGESLTGLWFNGQRHFAATLGHEHEEADLAVFAQTTSWLDAYFSGTDPDFAPPIAPSGSDFRQAVWKLMSSVPFGQMTTYGQISTRMAKERACGRVSAQAVGGAVAHNPILIILPCHRVVGARGSLTGYAGGIDKKAWLLEHEAVKMDGLFYPRHVIVSGSV